MIELQLPAAGNGIFAAGDTEPVSNLSQEREFSVQRQGDKISDFGTYSTAETAQTKKPGTHVFDNSDVLRASLSHHNYREWVVGTTGAAQCNEINSLRKGAGETGSLKPNRYFE